MQETATTNIRVIKKYQNRKLYDTKDSCYITLDEIAQLIKNGEDVTVVDNRTKGDVTSVILTQILVDQEKTKKSALPLTMLKSIIKSGQGSLVDFLQRYVVNRAESWEAAQSEAERYLDFLVNNDELSKSEAKSILRELSQNPGCDTQLEQALSSRLSESLNRLPNFTEIQNSISSLYKRLETLEQRLQQMERH